MRQFAMSCLHDRLITEKVVMKDERSRLKLEKMERMRRLELWMVAISLTSRFRIWHDLIRHRRDDLARHATAFKLQRSVQKIER
jgi:hypothetical protein